MHMSVLGIFMKHPLPGQVKTRLGQEIGHELAAELARAFQLDLLARTAGLAARRVLAYAPAEAATREHFQRISLPDDELWPQTGTSLGERLARFFEWCRADGVEESPPSGTGPFASSRFPVVVIGSDSPTIPADYIRTAFEELVRHDCVLGPAVDGGYYLVGLSRPVPELFAGIDWSSPRVLEQTVTRLKRGKHSLFLLPPWYDVDTREDLEFLRGHLHALGLAGTDELPLQTQAVLEGL
jgi:uncharacterized protein